MPRRPVGSPLAPAAVLLLLAACSGPARAQLPEEGCFSPQLHSTLAEGEQRLLPNCGGLLTCAGRLGLQLDQCADPETNVCSRLERAAAAADASFPLCCPRITCHDCYSVELDRYFGPGERWTGPHCVLHRCEVSGSGTVELVRETCPRPGAPPPHPGCRLVGQDASRGEHPLCCAHYRCDGRCLLNGETWVRTEPPAATSACTVQQALAQRLAEG